MTSNISCPPCLLLSLDPNDQQQLDREVTNFRCQAYVPTIKSTYVSQRCSCLSFCVYYGYQPLPGAALTLSRSTVFLAGSLSATSIPAFLNAVRILHLEHGLTNPTKNNSQLATTLRGIKCVKGKRFNSFPKETDYTPFPISLQESLKFGQPFACNFLGSLPSNVLWPPT